MTNASSVMLATVNLDSIAHFAIMQASSAQTSAWIRIADESEEQEWAELERHEMKSDDFVAVAEYLLTTGQASS